VQAYSFLPTEPLDCPTRCIDSENADTHARRLYQLLY
jgi:hypothetical protein